MLLPSDARDEYLPHVEAVFAEAGAPGPGQDITNLWAGTMLAAGSDEPQLLPAYLRELAQAFHAYYNAHAFLVDDAALRNARLALILAVRRVLASGLDLLGVSAPQTM